MKILKQNKLDAAVKALQKGQTIVFPTETSYGIGCDATNQSAVDKIYKIKGRTSDKPLLVVAPTVAMAKKYLVWNNTIESLANQFWPGPLTIIGKVKSLKSKVKSLSVGVVATDGTIAIRVTAFPALQKLAEKLSHPIVATSANLSGAGDVYSAAEAIKMFAEQKNQPDIILDYGELPHRPPSTIVRVVGGPSTRAAGTAQYGASKLKIIRQGELIIDNI